jgi:hypothetical protein
MVAVAGSLCAELYMEGLISLPVYNWQGHTGYGYLSCSQGRNARYAQYYFHYNCEYGMVYLCTRIWIWVCMHMGLQLSHHFHQ